MNPTENDLPPKDQTAACVTIENTWQEFALDIAARAVLGGFFAFCAAYYLNNAVANIILFSTFSEPLLSAVNILSTVAMIFFVTMTAYFYAVRLPPLSKFAGWVPAVVAVLGSFSTFGLLLFAPNQSLTISERLLSSALIIAGNLCALYSLRYLGKSFSILPQGRQLVTGGPYRFIRHPVYLAEAITTIGALIYFLCPLAIVLITCQLCLQLGRMHFEEKVLRKTFPQYNEYAKHTKKVIPFIY